MAIQSLGYIGVNATQLDSWKGFACGVMGLEDVSDTLGDAAPTITRWTTTPIGFLFRRQTLTTWRSVAGKRTIRQDWMRLPRH